MEVSRLVRGTVIVGKTSTDQQLMSVRDNHIVIIVSDLGPETLYGMEQLRHMFHSTHGMDKLATESKYQFKSFTSSHLVVQWVQDPL